MDQPDDWTHPKLTHILHSIYYCSFANNILHLIVNRSLLYEETHPIYTIKVVIDKL